MIRKRQKSTESLNFQLQQEKHQADALKEAVRKVTLILILMMEKHQRDTDNSSLKIQNVPTFIVLDFQERHQSLALMEKLNNEKQHKSELEVSSIHFSGEGSKVASKKKKEYERK